MLNEFELIERLKRKIPRKLQGRYGIGDDAAVLDGPGPAKWLFTTDAMVEGVDFIRGKIATEMAGRKALAMNLSDIAAMGSEPVAFVVTLGIPRNLKISWLEKFYEGMIRLAKKYKTSCVGGDITSAKQFFCSIALMGRANPGTFITRAGAKAGDWIGVTGMLGGSILGRHFRFEPRIHEARFLAREFRPNAMMDISDGLLQDLGHILKSSGVGARLDLDRIPVSRAAQKLSGGDQTKALKHALTDGEDFELLFTVSPRLKNRLERAWKRRFLRLSLSWIGRIQPGKGKIDCFRGKKSVPAPRFRKTGFSHF